MYHNYYPILVVSFAPRTEYGMFPSLGTRLLPQKAPVVH
jgi:hypothetical protein